MNQGSSLKKVEIQRMYDDCAVLSVGGEMLELMNWSGAFVGQVSYVDLLGVVRSKLVPSAAIGGMQRVGAGFAGYAAHFNMTAADPDVVWPSFLTTLSVIFDLNPATILGSHIFCTHCSHHHPHPTLPTYVF